MQTPTVESGPVSLQTSSERVSLALMTDHTISEFKYNNTGELLYKKFIPVAIGIKNPSILMGLNKLGARVEAFEKLGYS